MIRFSWAAVSDTGVKRPVNEDSYCARPDLGLFLVADGMGGHAAGEIASRLAAETVERVVVETAGGSSASQPGADGVRQSDADRLRGGLVEASRRIAEAMEGDATLRGMATTTSALLVAHDGPAVVAHVGDSRIYLLRDGSLSQVTRDHSWVEEQVRAGLLDRRAALAHPWRNIVTRALSGAEHPDIDVTTVALQTGDWIVLCSDGLSAVVREDQIESAIREAAYPEVLCRTLVALANNAGGPDNITVVVVRIDAA